MQSESWFYTYLARLEWLISNFSVVKTEDLLAFLAQRCARIRTTDSCAHASGASGGSDVRIHRYIDIYIASYNRKSVVSLVWGSLRLAPITLTCRYIVSVHE